METTKDKKPKKCGKGRQKLQERKNQGLQKERLYTSAASTTISAITEPIIEKLARAYQHLSDLEESKGVDPEPRAHKVLSGLGFLTEIQDKPMQEISVMWIMHVSLACVIFVDPSLILLYEPTNHLNMEAALWLERYLTTKLCGTLVVVLHDSHFLN